jgi:acyl-CoA synthetase (AMP-forming)/AMP-acid ligase II
MTEELESFVELLDQRVELSPDAVLVIDSNHEQVTFLEFHRRVQEAAAGFHGLGVTEGTVVSWQLPNLADTFVVFQALSQLGAVQSPLLMGFRERELTFLLGATRPSLLLVPGVWRGTDHEALGLKVVDALGLSTTVLDVRAGLPKADVAEAPRADSTSALEQVRYLYATSGSTGTPKLVRHCNRSLVAAGRGQARAMGYGPSDVAALVSSVAHIGGPIALAATLDTGCAMLLVDAFDPPGTLDLLAHFGTTIVNATPAAYLALVSEQRRRGPGPGLPSLRFCLSGGATVPPSLHGQIREHLGGRGLLPGYGMTEAGGIGAPMISDTDEQLERTVGIVMPGMSLRVVGADEREVSDGDIGEIRVAGPMVCDGYTDAAQTAEAFDEQGYLRTGDLGRIRSDRHLQVTGRIKDIIIRKGENISPKEVEDVMYSMPTVLEVAVVGTPDPDLGERVCAAVIMQRGAEPVTLEQVLQHCREAGLMIQKVPQRLDILEELPRTPLGKIDKRRLRQDLEASQADVTTE